MEARLLEYDEIPFWFEYHLTQDFPVNEVKPLENIMDLQAEGRYDIFVYQERDGPILGYATIWKAPGLDTFLLDYLGVPTAGRNLGMGSMILKDIRTQVLKREQEAGRYLEENGDFCLVVESETPLDDGERINELRRRRCGFYRRNGYVKMYEMGTCGVRFDAMAFEKVPANLEKVMREHKAVYGPLREDVVVPLGRNEEAPLPFWMLGQK